MKGILVRESVSALVLAIAFAIGGCSDEDCATIDGEEVCGQCVGDGAYKACGVTCDLCEDDADCGQDSAAVCDGSGNCVELNTNDEGDFDLEAAKAGYCSP